MPDIPVTPRHAPPGAVTAVRYGFDDLPGPVPDDPLAVLRRHGSAARRDDALIEGLRA